MKNKTNIFKPTISRIKKNLQKHFSGKDLKKRIKKKLHQIHFSYFSKNHNFSKILKNLKNIKSENENENENEIKKIFQKYLLNLQSSTAERSEILEKENANHFYSEIFENLKFQEKKENLEIVEFGCGTNIFTFPWILECFPKKKIKYSCFDIDENFVSFSKKIIEIFNFQNQIEIQSGDLLIKKQDFPKADIYFLFKILTVLESQEKNSSIKILKKIPAKYLIISYPTLTTSGKSLKSFQMKKNYISQFKNLFSNPEIKNLFSENFSFLEFENEIVFILEKKRIF